MLYYLNICHIRPCFHKQSLQQLVKGKKDIESLHRGITLSILQVIKILS